MLIQLCRIFEEILHVSFMYGQVCWQGGQFLIFCDTNFSFTSRCYWFSFGGWLNQSASWTLSAFCVSFGVFPPLSPGASSGHFTMLFLTWFICKVWRYLFISEIFLHMITFQASCSLSNLRSPYPSTEFEITGRERGIACTRFETGSPLSLIAQYVSIQSGQSW